MFKIFHHENTIAVCALKNITLWNEWIALPKKVCTVWSSELDTLLMRYGVKFTSYRIKSVSNSLNQIVVC